MLLRCRAGQPVNGTPGAQKSGQEPIVRSSSIQAFSHMPAGEPVTETRRLARDPGTLRSIHAIRLGTNPVGRNELGAAGITGRSGLQQFVPDRIPQNGRASVLLFALESA